MAEDLDLSDVLFSKGDGSEDVHSETTLKALTYLAALNGSEMRLSSVNDYKGYVPQMWRDVAEGRASDVDTIAWAKGVARAIRDNMLDAPGEAKDGERARDLATKSVGLSSNQDRNWEAREALLRFIDYAEFIREISPASGKFEEKPNRKECLTFMRSQGFYKGIDNKTAGLRVDRLLKEINQNS